MKIKSQCKKQDTCYNEVKLIQVFVGFFMFLSELGDSLGLSESTAAGAVFEK